MNYLGDFDVSKTIYLHFTTHAASGVPVAPSSAFVAADFKIYKNGSATERASAAGVTVTSPFDSVTGKHLVTIDTSDNTDAGFYAAGFDYRVEINSTTTVDGVIQSGVVIGTFSIKNRATPITLMPSVPNLAFWFEPRLGGLYQDSAGTTTAAIAADDPVGFLPDRSGNSYHATQATAGARPLLKLTGFNSLPCIRFDGSNDLLSLGNPATLTGASRSGWTATYCLSIVATTSYGTILSRGAEDVDVWDWFGTNVLSGTSQPLSPNYGFRFRGGLIQHAGGAISTATKYIITHRCTPTVGGGIVSNLHEWFINGQLASAMVLSNGSQGTSWSIGGRNDSAFYANVDLAGVTFYSRAITDSELQQVESYFAQTFNVQLGKGGVKTTQQAATGPVNLILEGNSISAGYRGHDSFYAQARPSIKYDHTVHQLAQDGKQTDACTAGIATRLAAVLDRTKLNVIVLNEITNHIVVGGVSATTAYNEVVNYCTAAKALGGNIRIIVMTPVSRNWSAGMETIRQSVMASLRANASPPWDFLLDVGGTTTISVYGTTYDVSLVGAPSAYVATTYFNDGVHPTRLGHGVIAAPLAAAINGLIDQYLDPIAVGTKAKTDLIPAIPAAVGSAMTLADNAITTAKVNDGAFTSAKFAAGAFDAVWSALTSGMTTTGSIGKKLADWVVVSGGSLSASDIRDAVGLASANLDTQLSGLPAAVWSATTRTLSAISDSSGVTTLLSRIGSALSFTSGRVDSHVVSMATDTITSASLTTGAKDAIATVVDSRLLDAGDATDFIAGLITRLGNTNVDQTALVTAFKASLFEAGSIANKLVVDSSGRVIVGTNADKTGYALTTAPLDAAGTRNAVGLSSANLATIIAAIQTSADAIKAKSDQLRFTVANQVDANSLTLGTSLVETIANEVSTAVGNNIRTASYTLVADRSFITTGVIRVKQRDDYRATEGRAYELLVAIDGVDFTSATVVAGAGKTAGTPVIVPTVSLINKTVGSCTLRLEFTSSQLNVAASTYFWDAHIVIAGRRNTVVEGQIIVEPKYADAPA